VDDDSVGPARQTYRNGKWHGLPVGWLLGFAGGLRSTGWFPLFFSDSFSFPFTLFSVLNFKSDFKSVLQALGFGTFSKIP
jgi:hypothetical protein